MGNLDRTAALAVLLLGAASTVCCTAAGPDAPPLPPETYGAEVTGPASAAPATPADPLPGSPDFAAIGAAAPPGKAVTFYSLDDANHLVRFASDAPSRVVTTPFIGLPPGESLAAITFRPADGILYGLGTASRLYRIDRQTGGVSPVMLDPFRPGLQGRLFGVAFGTDDKARVASDLAQNIAIDPVTGWVANLDASLAFADDDTFGAAEPLVVATTFAKGAFFGIDAAHDVLTRLAEPANGALSTVGALGVDVDDRAGIDVTGDGQAYAVLRAGGQSSLYAIDLATGAATYRATVGTTALHGLAIER